MRQFLVAAGLFAAALTGAPAAHAQLSESRGPVSYEADNLEYFDDERRLLLSGDVQIVQNDATLRADRVTLFFAPAGAGAAQSEGSSQALGAGDVQRMIAEGEVYYVRTAQTARGNRAVYEVAQDAVTFTGNVVVASDENVIRGETLVLQIGSRRTTIRPQSGERVRGVFVPRNTPPQQSGGGR